MAVRSPQTSAEWSAYYQLRYEVLRQPWQQPVGSERVPEDEDPATVHALCLMPTDAVAGVGMLQSAGQGRGQIRFMAVAPAWQGHGIGRELLGYLEEVATQLGYAEIVLHARQAAVPFYVRLGYAIVAPSHTLFGSIPHFLMSKELAQ
ncbi:GNAT family N-acetyltransferase [Hymenobacter sp. BT186]|uniref:GNAT family N-acetyltransferase n=1 Tax=Hymenobacter telluris TaxID=2816474 RepID=A0A939EUZ9_9BACT|nr:GNAT family N-acetyltransferase [Hymenobacter telluris]MBO0356977.1 GNAT family N-acetyltransferase [Hymenobacter telluris]MBW3373004.1 GNAT family N-acetyltransferase [Hymenobacter norwichensis]